MHWKSSWWCISHWAHLSSGCLDMPSTFVCCLPVLCLISESKAANLTIPLYFDLENRRNQTGSSFNIWQLSCQCKQRNFLILFLSTFCSQWLWLSLSILDLWKVSTNALITGICIQHKLSFGLWMNQDWSLTQHFLVLLERLFLFLIPLRRSILLSASSLGFAISLKWGMNHV